MEFRQFLRECAELMEATADRHPYFWAGLREELGRARLARGNRDERATQVVLEGTDRAIQASPIVQDRATQTAPEPEESSEGSLEARGREPTRRVIVPPRGCWNCGGQHRYSECSRPIRTPFCFRCGHPGITIRDCPQCREEWRAEDSRRAGRSRSEDPPRGQPSLRGRIRGLN
ncbi:hypothetical protein ACFW04_011262 [Cataglyphis niger]